MAKVHLEDPIAGIRGRIGTDQKIIFRTRNGRTHAYVIEHPNTRPHNEAQRAHTSAFGAVSQQVHAEMADPARLAFWQTEFEEYQKKNRKRRSRSKKVEPPTYSSRRKPVISTLYGFIFHTLYEQNKQ